METDSEKSNAELWCRWNVENCSIHKLFPSTKAFLASIRHCF